jgi:glyoxylase-like metal-dependent hydrolase (beta-lactamase superfamily II)
LGIFAMTFANAHHQHTHAPLITPALRHFGDGIYALDSGYFRDEFDAVHLVVEGGRVAIIDTSTKYPAPRVMESIRALGLGPEHVDWIVLTHVHLDHAGGAGELMRLCPNAQLTVHPRGTRHMVDPSKLWAAVCEVYGTEMAEREYGSLEPIAQDRILETPEGTTITLAGRTFEFWDAPGHAKHHVYIRDTKTNSFFTGDTFGISYRDFDTSIGAYIFVTSSPSQFSPDELGTTMRRLLATKPPAVYLTHYAQVRDVARHGETLLRQTDQYAEIGLRHQGAGSERAALIRNDLTRLMLRDLHTHGVTLSERQCLEVLDLDLKLNSDGLVCWLDTLKR